MHVDELPRELSGQCDTGNVQQETRTITSAHVTSSGPLHSFLK